MQSVVWIYIGAAVAFTLGFLIAALLGFFRDPAQADRWKAGLGVAVGRYVHVATVLTVQADPVGQRYRLIRFDSKIGSRRQGTVIPASPDGRVLLTPCGAGDEAAVMIVSEPGSLFIPLSDLSRVEYFERVSKLDVKA